MIYFQQLLTAISLLQVPNVLYNLSGDEDARTSLDVLAKHIETSTEVISSVIPDTWKDYAKSAEEEKQNDLGDLLGDFNALINTIGKFRIDVSGAEECTIAFKQTPLIGEDTIKDTDSSSEDDIFINLQRLASVEISKITKQYEYLQAEYEASCGETKINCEGTSKNIIAEVERLIPGTTRASIDLLIETLLLMYDVVVDRWSLHAYIASHLDSTVHNLTACIASKIEESALEPSNTTFQQSNGSISDSYRDLVNVSLDALFESQEILLSYETSLVDQSTKDYLVTITNIRNVTYIANQTINTLHDMAQLFNLTQTCALPDVRPVLNSSLSRGLEEYTELGILRVSFITIQGLNNINVTVEEITSIALQIEGCSGGTTCDYLEEKIDRKMTEIPTTTRSLANSAAVLMHKSVSAVRKSRYNVVRDVLEQLGVNIVSLKACIRDA